MSETKPCLGWNKSPTGFLWCGEAPTCGFVCMCAEMYIVHCACIYVYQKKIGDFARSHTI